MQAENAFRRSNPIVEFFCLHRKNLLLNLVQRNFRTRYKGSALGYIWTLAIPMGQVLVFYFVYQVILKVSIPHYLAFIVTGILPWVFFSSTVGESMESLVGAQSLLTHMPMPLQVFPAASVVTNFISFVIAWPVIAGAIFLSGIDFSWTMLIFLPLVGLLLLFTYSLAFILGALFVLFRDLKHIFSIFLQLWMYSTPILYSAELVPEQYRWILYLNPLSGFFIGLRDVMIEGRLPDPGTLATFCAWTLLLVIVANIMRATIGPRLVEKL